jgi:hypothetical protein
MSPATHHIVLPVLCCAPRTLTLKFLRPSVERTVSLLPVRYPWAECEFGKRPPTAEVPARRFGFTPTKTRQHECHSLERKLDRFIEQLVSWPSVYCKPSAPATPHDAITTRDSATPSNGVDAP